MRLWLKVIGFFMITIIFNSRLSAQQKDSINIGAIKGTVKDTSLNYYLQAATVSVYNLSNKLIAYSLTNSYGEFTIKGLPINIPLELRISFVGYKTFLKGFEASLQRNTVDAGQVALEKSSGLLDNVIVTPPPVRMNHDTLEFSAQAFTLDKNAVAEDLLRKLPGVIVWGDGTITVNGRQINKLLVDGKPFLTGENKVATQNIPKSAIDKVQVYQEFVDPNNPYDSITSINFKLRKNMHNGLFGVVSAGIGIDEKYQSIVNLNVFNPRNQFAIVGQSNNINKSGDDINTILRNNTFKGKGVKVEYQPDFNLPGVNKQSSGGFLYTHDFINDFNQEKQDRLSVNSFINQFSNNTIKQTTILNFIGNDSALTQQINNSSLTDNTEFTLSSRYNKLKNYNSHL